MIGHPHCGFHESIYLTTTTTTTRKQRNITLAFVYAVVVVEELN